jgi:hypothetical protein
MAIELGPAQAILYGTTPPSNTNVLWGETDNNDPQTQQVLNFKRFDKATSLWVLINSNDPEWQVINW